MIPFHIIYGFLFKSFSIGWETKLIERLIDQWYTKLMIIKRSWIFVLWIFISRGLILFALSLASSLIAWIGITDPNLENIKWMIVIGNLIMGLILFFGSFSYLRHFRNVHNTHDEIITDLDALKWDLKKGDSHFIRFFNWSLTNQFILVIFLLFEIWLVFFSPTKFTDAHIWFLLIDFLIIGIEFYYLGQYRKRMIDAEMDFNVVVQGKIFFVNQTGVLSDTQNIESDKIKTIKSSFPGKIASIFNFGNIEILTEWDASNLGEMTMLFVMNPIKVVNNIQRLLWESRSIPPIERKNEEKQKTKETIIINTDPNISKNIKQEIVHLHTIDTRSKVRDIMR